MGCKIMIDAGHGGKDPGAVSGKYYEKTAALAISKRLYKTLTNSGYSVSMTRNDDRYLTLAERCDKSNRYDADVFLSIHLNSSSNKNASGIECWKYSKTGKLTVQIAKDVQTELIQATGWKDRGVKDSSVLYVLKHTKAHAVLIECGFISNDEERKKLFNEKYQDKIAKAIASAISANLKTY
jgi:N-acetylmuramoyl-L-alanine amidase